jgi:general secretion pathway protein I
MSSHIMVASSCPGKGLPSDVDPRVDAGFPGRTRTKSAPTAGFTIIEALVALALVAVLLASIAPLMAIANRGVRSVEQHVALVSAARSVESGLPQRDQLTPGNLTGELAGNRWRVDILPFAASAIDGGSPSRWTPQTIVITVRSPSGATLRLNTVRLSRGGGGE